MKNTKGITLIALIITIIVMLILVTVTITTSINGGLFNYAKKAADRTNQEMAREQIESILPFYYLEKDNMTLEEFLVGNLQDDITAIGYEYTDDYNDSQRSKLFFNYKLSNGYCGFTIDLATLKLTALDNPIKLFEQISNEDDLEEGKQYLIASGPTSVANFSDIGLVLDKPQENESGTKNRLNKIYDVAAGQIAYNGDYALRLDKKDGSYIFYDAKENKYLNVSQDLRNSLVLGNQDALAKCSITFNAGAAQIVFSGRAEYNVIRNSDFITTCYSSGTTGNSEIYLYKEVGYTSPNRLATPDVIQTPDDKKVTLTWDPVDGAISYSVSWKDEAGNKDTEAVTECKFVKEGLNNGYAYYYQVRANSTDPSKVNSNWTDETIAIPTTGTYELVTNESELISGSTYLIATAKDGKAYTIGAQNGKYRDPVEVTIENQKISLTNDFYPFRLEVNAGNWSFKDLKNNGYLLGGSKSFGINTSTGIQNFTASIDSSSYVASIKYDSYYLKYNSGSPRFTCYFSGQNDIYLYKEAGETVLPTPAVTATAINGTVTLNWGMATEATYYLIWNGEEKTTPITSPYTLSGLSNGTEYTYQIKAVKGEEIKLSEETTVTPIATKTYELVTDVSELSSGASYLLVNSKTAGTAYSMKSANKNNISSQQVTILSTNPVTIEYSGKESYDYVLEKDNANNAWKIREDIYNAYLYTPYDSNTLKMGGTDEISTDDANITNIDLFNISFGDTNNNVIISGFCSVLQQRSIKFNTSSNVFSFYKPTSSGVTEIYLFKCID